MARKLPAIAPPGKMTFVKASNVNEAESWIEEMEMMFSMADTIGDNDAARMQEVLIWMDPDLRRWLKGVEMASGAPIKTWDLFKAAFRDQFQSKRAPQQAIEDLLQNKQQPGESMDKYLMRAAKLVSRTDGGFSSEAAMQITLLGVEKNAWPHAWATAQREVSAKKVKTFEDLRMLLQREALSEPKTAARSSAPASQHKNSWISRIKDKKLRAAAVSAMYNLASDDEGEEESDDDDVDRSIAAVKQRAKERGRGPKKPHGDGCARCKKPGHFAADCTQADTRTCFTCHKKGHISTTCPDKKPKNE
jgi:hypothetical protein